MNIKQDSDESTGSIHDESTEIVFKTGGMSLVWNVFENMVVILSDQDIFFTPPF